MEGMVPITNENSFNEMLEIDDNLHYIGNFGFFFFLHENSINLVDYVFNFPIILKILF